MSKQGRLSYWFVICMVIIGTITTVVEGFTVIPMDQLVLFLGVRAFLLSLGLPAAILFRKKPYSSFGHLLFGALLVLYTSHGQWYRPFYEYTFFQALVFYTLLLYPPKKIFLSVLILGSLVFLSVYIYRFDAVVLNSKTTLEENYMSIIAFSLTLFGIYKVFSEERAFKEQALARFGYLGKHSAAILHDLKSTVAIPRIYTELAEEELENGNIEGAKHRLKETLNSLDAMKTIIVKFNQMSQLTHFEREHVNLRQVIEEVREVLRPKTQNIQFEITGEAYIEINRPFAFSFLLNLVMNSVEIFESRQTANPRIEIFISEKRLIITDNGGGFSSEVLDRIESGVSASTKMEASGLGLFLLIDGIRNMGGKMMCSNTQYGARIEILFRSKFPNPVLNNN